VNQIPETPELIREELLKRDSMAVAVRSRMAT
jgi:hypothetical protein